jgi:uncharacterized membrane protein YdbT with pleckstrin-like domain
MVKWIQSRVLAFARLPAQPHPPEGAAESVRIFHAGWNYYRLRIMTWLIISTGALGGWLVSYLFFARFVHQLPYLVQLGWGGLELLTLAGLIASLPVTFLEQRLNFQLRWYIVTDRSLRIRSGIWSVQELTSTFANIQEIRVTAGPLQKILGLADVEIHSAGGGGGAHKDQNGHIARFEGVENANEIRDLMIDRLRQYRDAGLGEADGAHPLPQNVKTMAAAGILLDEARALRAAVQQR